MSTSTIQREDYECDGDGCDEHFPAREAVAGSFCSVECYHRHRGAKLLAHVRQDHRLCTACFRWVKEVEPPPSNKSVVVPPVDHEAAAPEATDVLIGWEHLTRHAELGERDVTVDADVDRDDDRAPPPSDTIVRTGATCRCGTTDHRDDWLREARVLDVAAAARRLARALSALAAEGQDDRPVDVATLARTLRETLDETGALDWELAVGRAVDS